MLRMDAEENSAPRYVLTLTSRDPVTDAKAYQGACAVFWRAFRRRWGKVEYCGFVEWTTGDGPRSGGFRRLHSHWLIKAEGLDVDAVQAWASAEWCKLTGAWIVQLAELRTVGGVVGYLALHHEKMEQAPPAGWTGRRLRPSKGYFAQPGEIRRERARLWLAQHRELQREWPAELPRERPRVVWSRPEWDRDADAAASAPGERAGSTLRSIRAHELRLRSPEAPINADHNDALAQDELVHAAIVRRHYARKLAAKIEAERTRYRSQG